MEQRVLLYFIAGMLFAVLVLVLRIAYLLFQLIDAVSRIAESKRLTTILAIEAKKDLDIALEDFEPKKDALRKALLKVLEEKQHPDPGVLAYCIFEESGFGLFVEGEVKLKAQNALGRLLANGNTKGARKFVLSIVKNL